MMLRKVNTRTRVTRRTRPTKVVTSLRSNALRLYASSVRDTAGAGGDSKHMKNKESSKVTKGMHQVEKDDPESLSYVPNEKVDSNVSSSMPKHSKSRPNPSELPTMTNPPSAEAETTTTPSSGWSYGTGFSGDIKDSDKKRENDIDKGLDTLSKEFDKLSAKNDPTKNKEKRYNELGSTEERDLGFNKEVKLDREYFKNLEREFEEKNRKEKEEKEAKDRVFPDVGLENDRGSIDRDFSSDKTDPDKFRNVAEGTSERVRGMEEIGFTPPKREEREGEAREEESSTLGNIIEKVAEVAGTVKEKVGNLAHKAMEKAGETKEKAGEMVGSMMDKANMAENDLREKYKESSDAVDWAAKKAKEVKGGGGDTGENMGDVEVRNMAERMDFESGDAVVDVRHSQSYPAGKSVGNDDTVIDSVKKTASNLKDSAVHKFHELDQKFDEKAQESGRRQAREVHELQDKIKDKVKKTVSG